MGGSHSSSSTMDLMYTMFRVLFVCVSGSLADTSDGLWNTMSGPIGMYERQTQAPYVWMDFRAHAPADVFPLSRRGVQKTPGATLSQTKEMDLHGRPRSRCS